MYGSRLAFVLILALSARAATAAVIDFETTPAGGVPTDDGVLLTTTPYNISGLLVSFGFDFNSDGVVETPATFEKTGTFPGEPPLAGFSGSSGLDTPDPGFGPQLGNWFLRSPVGGANFGKFVIQYTSGFPVTAASGEIWDIDGNQQLGVTEEYTVQAFDAASTLLATIVSPLGVLDTPIAPLDGRPWVFAFSGLSAGIDHIVVTFTGTKPNGIGLAFNNFDPVAVPEPASTSLAALAAAAGLGAAWRRPCCDRRGARCAGRSRRMLPGGV
jgi:hypothetical protein